MLRAVLKTHVPSGFALAPGRLPGPQLPRLRSPDGSLQQQKGADVVRQSLCNLFPQTRIHRTTGEAGPALKRLRVLRAELKAQRPLLSCAGLMSARMGSIPAAVMPRPGACRPNHTLSTEARMILQLDSRFDVTLLLAQQRGCHNAKQTALQLTPLRSKIVKFTQCTPVLVCIGWNASISVDWVWLFQSVP